jgi:hypothetical protein
MPKILQTSSLFPSQQSDPKEDIKQMTFLHKGSKM